MSVQLYSQEAINRLVGMMKHHEYALKDTMRRTLIFNHFNQWGDHDGLLSIHLLYRMLWYCIVANRTAYALQYECDASFFEVSVKPEDVDEVPCSAYDFFKALTHLAYNMETNAGINFLSDHWDKALRDIQVTLLRIAAQSTQQKE